MTAPLDIPALLQLIDALNTDARFAAAEGGSEYDEVKSRYGQFFVQHGSALLAAFDAMQQEHERMAAEAEEVDRRLAYFTNPSHWVGTGESGGAMSLRSDLEQLERKMRLDANCTTLGGYNAQHLRGRIVTWADRIAAILAAHPVEPKAHVFNLQDLDVIREALDNAVENGCAAELAAMSDEDVAYDLARHDAACERFSMAILVAGVRAWRGKEAPARNDPAQAVDPALSTRVAPNGGDSGQLITPMHALVKQWKADYERLKASIPQQLIDQRALGYAEGQASRQDMERWLLSTHMSDAEILAGIRSLFWGTGGPTR